MERSTFRVPRFFLRQYAKGFTNLLTPTRVKSRLKKPQDTKTHPRRGPKKLAFTPGRIVNWPKPPPHTPAELF